MKIEEKKNMAQAQPTHLQHELAMRRKHCCVTRNGRTVGAHEVGIARYTARERLVVCPHTVRVPALLLVVTPCHALPV